MLVNVKKWLLGALGPALLLAGAAPAWAQNYTNVSDESIEQRLGRLEETNRRLEQQLSGQQQQLQALPASAMLNADDK